MPAAIGHNQPAPMTPEAVAAYLAEICADLVARQAEILGGINRFRERFPTISDEDTQAKAADFAGNKGAIAGFLKLNEAQRIQHKQPFDQAAGAVQTFFKRLAEPIEAGQRDIRARMTQFATKLEEERRRAAREEAERAANLAREAEERALATMKPEAIDTAAELAKTAERAQATAEAKPAEHSRVKGYVSNSTVSLRTTWRFNEAESDLMELAKAVVAGKADPKYLAFNTVALGYAIRSEGLRTLPGCKIEEVRSV